MSRKRKILLAIYSAMVLIFGIFQVPVKSVWGPERTIHTSRYTTVWNVVDKHHKINGFNPINELDMQRIILTLMVLTIITFVFYLILDNKNKDE